LISYDKGYQSITCSQLEDSSSHRTLSPLNEGWDVSRRDNPDNRVNNSVGLGLKGRASTAGTGNGLEEIPLTLLGQSGPCHRLSGTDPVEHAEALGLWLFKMFSFT
jgi:hypothetical protein